MDQKSGEKLPCICRFFYWAILADSTHDASPFVFPFNVASVIEPGGMLTQLNHFTFMTLIHASQRH